MSQAKHDHVLIPARLDRPKLYRVGQNKNSPASPTPQATGAGLAWARDYRTRLRVSDTVVIAMAVLAAYLVQLRFSPSPVPLGDLRPDQWALYAIIIVVWTLTLAAYHTRDHRIVGTGATEYKQVVTACAMTFGLLAMSLLILDWDPPSRYFVLTLPLGILGLMLNRWLWRQWLAGQRAVGNYLSRVIVVGSLEDVDYAVNRMDLRNGAAYTVIGIVLDAPSGVGTKKTIGIPVFSGLDSAAEAAATLGADAVIVAGQPSGGADFIRDLAWKLEGTAAELILASRLANVAGPRIHFRPVEGLPLIHVEIPQFDGGRHIVKRAMDVTAAATAIVLLAPLLLVLAVLVRLDSPGPALFSQYRVGRDGRRFRMWKFRSMVVTAPDELTGLIESNDAAGPLFKLKDDPRVTRVGRVLRKYSLDELPQFWNVLIGDMSLVGPRPPLPREVLGYERHVLRRLYIKPGLTGMWQVNGRSDLNWEDSVRLDLYYVENWSVVGDFIILWRTVKMLLHPVGAY
ncbi:MAG TPA: sugar transferase [Homoserinimonas sp.]|nr:sugar transferase [Homoserinimonas sp.]